MQVLTRIPITNINYIKLANYCPIIPMIIDTIYGFHFVITSPQKAEVDENLETSTATAYNDVNNRPTRFKTLPKLILVYLLNEIQYARSVHFSFPTEILVKWNAFGSEIHHWLSRASAQEEYQKKMDNIQLQQIIKSPQPLARMSTAAA